MNPRVLQICSKYELAENTISLKNVSKTLVLLIRRFIEAK